MYATSTCALQDQDSVNLLDGIMVTTASSGFKTCTYLLVLYNQAPDIDWLQSSLDFIDDANVKLPCPDGLAIASTFVTQTEH